MSDPGITHWDGCWNVHLGCALSRLAEAQQEVERWHREALDWQQAKSEADDAWEAAERLAEQRGEALREAQEVLRAIDHIGRVSNGYDELEECIVLVRAYFVSRKMLRIRTAGEPGYGGQQQ